MSLSPHITRVAVLRGGPSDLYEHSLETGRQIISHMPEEYIPIDVFISRDGAWHQGGIERSPQKILSQVDMVMNALHGAYGEDGTVQKILEHFNVPYSGSHSIASALGMNKALTKRALAKHEIKSPVFVSTTKEEFDNGISIEKVFTSIPFPIIVKPVNSQGERGITKVTSKGELKDALEKSFAYSDTAIAEEYIRGKEIVGGVIEGYRGLPYYKTLPQSVDGSALSHEESHIVQDAAAFVHNALGLRHYSSSDFILHPRRGLYFLEVNTLPLLAPQSKFVRSLEAVGSSIKEFVAHILSKVRARQ